MSASSLPCDHADALAASAHIALQIVPGETMDDVLRSVHYDPNELVEGPSRRRQNTSSDATDALKALLTQQRSLSTYLERS